MGRNVVGRVLVARNFFLPPPGRDRGRPPPLRGRGELGVGAYCLTALLPYCLTAYCLTA